MANPFLPRLWYRLTEPSTSIQDAAERRHAQLLASLYLLMLPMGVFGVFLQYTFATAEQRSALLGILLLMIIIGVVVVFGYLLARTRYYPQVALFTLAFATIGVSAAVFLHPSPLNSDTLLFFIVPIILGGVFLTIWRAIPVIAFNLIVLLIVAKIDNRLDFNQVIIGPFGVVFMTSAILLLSFTYRNLLEQDRQADVSRREARYRALLETAFEAVALYEDLRITEHNLGFSRTFGYNTQLLEGRPVLSFIDSKSHKMVNEALAIGSSIPIEALGLRENGSAFNIEFVCKTIDYGGQATNILAVRDISSRKQIEDQLRASLGDKEVLLREIHHRVKNNLQVISSLLNLQAARLRTPDLLAQIQDSQNRIRSMALIHEQLYRAKDFAHINFGIYLYDLTRALVKTYQELGKVIDLRVEADPVFLHIDTAMPCGLLVNELVSNALKHAFDNRFVGLIQVELRDLGKGTYRLIVKDDGVGFPSAMDFRNTTSLGLQLVNNLVRQLNGTIDLQTESGTTFLIVFGPTQAPRQ